MPADLVMRSWGWESIFTCLKRKQCQKSISHGPICVPICQLAHATTWRLLLEELIDQSSLFAVQGFAPFTRLWQQMDGLKGRLVDIAAGRLTLHGTVAGIDGNGALLLDTGAGILSLHSGEVSIMSQCTG